jgi:hypothetical protein
MIKLPSVHYLGAETLRVAVRFISPVIITFIGTTAGLMLIDDHTVNEHSDLYARILLTSLLGLPLLLSACLCAETWGGIKPATANDATASTDTPIHKPNNTLFWLLQGAGIVILVLYYFSLPDNFESSYGYIEIVMMRFVLLWLSMHFLVSIVPYIKSGSVHGFWQYNQFLFTRILTSALYSAVLFIGLAVALLAINQLFEVNIRDTTYARLFVVISGLFNTFFFLAGVPQSFDALEKNDSYPFGLKVFTQYVLIPLVTIYLSILYAYTAKILVQWQLPNGWVSYLVLCFSVVGILAILLVYPIRHQSENTWIRSYRRFFFLALIPLIVLLYVGIMRRIIDYGFTENRYFVFILAGWLAGITLYFNFSKQRNIKILPLSLCLVALLSSFGPWGAFEVSKRSQISRLEYLLQSNNMLGTDHKAIAAPKAISEQTQTEISETLRYLYNRHGKTALQPYFNADLQAISDKIGNYAVSDSLARFLAISNNSYAFASNDIELYLAEANPTVSVSDYDVYVPNLDIYVDDASATQQYTFTHRNETYTLGYNKDKQQLELYSRGQIAAQMAMDTLAKRLELYYEQNNNTSLPNQIMVSRAETPAANIKIMLKSMTLANGSHKIRRFNADILLGLKQP